MILVKTVASKIVYLSYIFKISQVKFSTSTGYTRRKREKKQINW